MGSGQCKVIRHYYVYCILHTAQQVAGSATPVWVQVSVSVSVCVSVYDMEQRGRLKKLKLLTVWYSKKICSATLL